MKAAILAAGEGTRLQPLTATRPKHLVNVGGKPILEHCLAALKGSGITEVVIVVRYMADMIKAHFGDGNSIGMKIEYVEQNGFFGTGDALSIVEPHVKEDFLLVNGDLLFDTDPIKAVIALHQKEKTATTMAVVPVDKPENYGIVELEDDKKVKRVIEKPSREQAPTNLANAGIYVFSTEIFPILRKISPSPRGEIEIPDALTLLIKDNKTVAATKISKEQWLDIGTPWDLLEANRWILSRMKTKVEGTVENGAHLVGHVAVAETARIRSGAYIEGPTCIGPESDIGPNCYVRTYTSIGKKVRIGNACEIKNSILMDHVHVGHLSYLGDSVIGEHSNLGAGTITANYRLDAKTIKMMIKDKITDSGRNKLGVVLGDNVKTGINALFMPGIKIGNDSWVGPNVLVKRDIPSNSKVFLQQDIEQRS